MKKLPYLKSVFAILLVAVMITACSKSTPSSSETSGASPSPSSTSSGSSDSSSSVEITFSVAEYDSKMQADMDDLIKRFQDENPNIQVKLLISNWNNYHDRLVAWVAGGQAPDIANLSGLWIGEFDDMEALKPLDGYVDAGFLGSFYQGPLESFKKDGKLMGVPYFLDPRVLYYRKDLFDQHQLQPPKTWDDIYNAAKVLNSPPNVYGFGVGGKYPNVMTGFEYFYFNAGKDVAPVHFGQDHELLFNSPEGVKALSFLDKLVKEKLTNPGPTDVEWENGVQPIFQSGKLGMMITGPWFAGMLDADKKFEYGMVPVPVADGSVQSRAVMQPDVISVMSADDAKKEAIGKFLAFMYKPENRLTFALNHGNIPEIEAVGKDPKWLNQPHNEFFASLLPTAINKYSDTGKFGDQMDHTVTEEIQKVYLNRQTPEEAFKAAAEKVKALYGG